MFEIYSRAQPPVCDRFKTTRRGDGQALRRGPSTRGYGPRASIRAHDLVDQPSRRRRPVRATLASHRLERAVELDVDQQCATAPDPLGDEIRRLVHGLGPLRLDAE